MHPLETIRLESLSRLANSLQSLVRGRLWVQVLIGMFLGIAVGVGLGPSAELVERDVADSVGNWLALPGMVFLRSIQMIVIPLVFASIIRGLASSEDMGQLRQVGLFGTLYLVVTTTTAITIGIAVASLIEPGRYVDIQAGLSSQAIGTMPAAGGIDVNSLPDALIGLIPTNPLNSMVDSEMLGVVVFAIVLGVALVSLPNEQSEPLLSLLGSLQQVCMTVVSWAMRIAPLAVFGLMAQLAARLGLEALLGMSIYVGTVLLALGLLVLFYMGIVLLAARRHPWRFLGKIRDVQLLAFSTSSSAAVMPLSIRTAEQKLNVKPSIAQFVVPLGATVNMDGTALYQGVATMFLAQAYGLQLSTGQLSLVVVTTVAASIGSPATPGVGMVILSMVLSSVGIPLEGIALIMGVDRLLDMSRTAVNVTGDLVAVVVLDRFIGNASARHAALGLGATEETSAPPE